MDKHTPTPMFDRTIDDPVARMRARLDAQDRMQRRVRFGLALGCGAVWVVVGYIGWCIL